VGNACPWCHRCLLALALTGLDGHVTWTEATDDAERASRGGWVFDAPEPVFGKRDLREVYDELSPGYRGRCTAPLLVDKASGSIVSNESADIARMLNSLAQALPRDLVSGVDLAPPGLDAEIDEANAWVYEGINNAVYRSGFATSQEAYEAAQGDLWAALDRAEGLLSKRRFLLGDRLTESDLRLYPTIVRRVDPEPRPARDRPAPPGPGPPRTPPPAPPRRARRFDSTYSTLFRCSRRRIVGSYPHLLRWLRELHHLHLPGTGLQVRDTFDCDRARASYFGQLFPLNPGGIVPAGPDMAEVLGYRPGDAGALGARWTPDDVASVAHVRG